MARLSLYGAACALKGGKMDISLLAAGKLSMSERFYNAFIQFDRWKLYFEGLEKIISKRLRESTIGFSSARSSSEDYLSGNIFQHATTRDFIDFGFEPEFIGRLPVRVVCNPLNEEDLYQILKSSEGSIIRQYEQSFGAYQIEVFFHDEALRQIARLAAQEQTGARGLMTICERVLREYKFEFSLIR